MYVAQAKGAQLISEIKQLESFESGIQSVFKNYSSVFLLFDKNLSSRVKKLEKSLTKSQRKVFRTFVLSGSDSIKNFLTYQKILESVQTSGADRKSVLITLGGGAVGDIGGFVASTYMRGISWINIPTTLLSMVDSSYGGKTGINFKNFKNLVGSFYVPNEIWIDLSTLKSLPTREITSGFGEILKYALLFNRKRFLKFESSDIDVSDDASALFWVTASLKHKSSVVRKDPRDLKGVRELLNLGHTFAHALEAESSSQLRHGEAVVWGLRYAALASVVKDKLSQSECEKILNQLSLVPVPSLPKVTERKLWANMKKDKKSIAGQVRLVGLRAIAKPFVGLKISEKDHRKVMQKLKGLQ